MLRNFLLVGAGGAAGSMLRYAAGLLLPRHSTLSLPLATLLVNLAGCLLIGLLAGWGERSAWMSQSGWPLLAVGLCGGFTTFSAFSLESVRLIGGGAAGTALLYVLLSTAGGMLLCAGGYYLSTMTR